MGWNYKECAEKKAAVLALTESQQESLTWENARDFVPWDTLCNAAWNGEYQRREVTPFEALCRVHHIDAAALAKAQPESPPATGMDNKIFYFGGFVSPEQLKYFVPDTSDPTYIHTGYYGIEMWIDSPVLKTWELASIHLVTVHSGEEVRAEIEKIKKDGGAQVSFYQMKDVPSWKLALLERRKSKELLFIPESSIDRVNLVVRCVP